MTQSYNEISHHGAAKKALIQTSSYRWTSHTNSISITVDSSPVLSNSLLQMPPSFSLVTIDEWMSTPQRKSHHIRVMMTSATISSKLSSHPWQESTHISSLSCTLLSVSLCPNSYKSFERSIHVHRVRAHHSSNSSHQPIRHNYRQLDTIASAIKGDGLQHASACIERLFGSACIVDLRSTSNSCSSSTL